MKQRDETCGVTTLPEVSCGQTGLQHVDLAGDNHRLLEGTIGPPGENHVDKHRVIHSSLLKPLGIAKFMRKTLHGVHRGANPSAWDNSTEGVRQKTVPDKTHLSLQSSPRP